MESAKPAIPEKHLTDRRGTPYTVREAHPDDAAGLLTMIRAVFAEGLPGLLTLAEEFTITEEQEREFLTAHRVSETSAAFIAVHAESEVLGFLDGRVSPRWKLQHTWSFGMSIAKPHRGGGIGRALLEHAIAYVIAHPQVLKMGLEVIADNTPARRLYESLGFIEEGRRIKHVRQKTAEGSIKYADEILMYRWVGDGHESEPVAR